MSGSSPRHGGTTAQKRGRAERWARICAQEAHLTEAVGSMTSVLVGVGATPSLQARQHGLTGDRDCWFDARVRTLATRDSEARHCGLVTHRLVSPPRPSERGWIEKGGKERGRGNACVVRRRSPSVAAISCKRVPSNRQSDEGRRSKRTRQFALTVTYGLASRPGLVRSVISLNLVRRTGCSRE